MFSVQQINVEQQVYLLLKYRSVSRSIKCKYSSTSKLSIYALLELLSIIEEGRLSTNVCSHKQRK